jgi:hypothetical protein
MNNFYLALYELEGDHVFSEEKGILPTGRE